MNLDLDPGPRLAGPRDVPDFRLWLLEQWKPGAGWSEHRPVFVESHVRGPKDKPLVVREAVKVIRGDP